MFEVHVQSVGVTHHCLYEVMWGEGGAGQNKSNNIGHKQNTIQRIILHWKYLCV